MEKQPDQAPPRAGAPTERAPGADGRHLSAEGGASFPRGRGDAPGGRCAGGRGGPRGPRTAPGVAGGGHRRAADLSGR